MSRVFAISDLHFNNENIIKYCDRPFENAEHQTLSLIENWNNTVRDEDIVIVCGDFIMGNPNDVPRILNLLNGKVILVRGNHDTDRKLEFYKDNPRKIIKICDTHYHTHAGIFFVFCHFPLVSGEYGEMVSRRHKDVAYVHGHVHNSLPFENKEQHAFNVSADVVDFTPISINTLALIASGWKGRRNSGEA